MEEERDIHKDLDLSYSDYAHSGIKAALSTIPGIGGPLSEFFSVVISPPLMKRRDEWIINIYERLVLLEGKFEEFKIESLSENENFISTLFYATQIAMRSHQKEKLEALKNVVFNSIFTPNIDENKQIIFLNILDRYSPLHLTILNFLDNPRKFSEENKVNYSNWVTTSIAHALECAFPELEGKRDFYDQIANDLFNDGLINSRDIHITMNTRVVFESHTTNLGKELLKFINFDL